MYLTYFWVLVYVVFWGDRSCGIESYQGYWGEVMPQKILEDILFKILAPKQ